MRNNRRRVDGLSASVRLFLALALFMSSSPGAGAEPTGSSVLRAASVEDLAEALDELGEAIRAKVDDDLNATASALWYVYDIEQALNGNLAAWAYAAWTGLRAWVSTVNQLKNLGEIWQQLPRIAASGNWISLASYITSMGSLFEAGDGLAFALNGPSYAEGVKNMYDDAGRAGGAQAFQDSIKNSLHTIVWIRPPKPQHDRAILYGGLTLNNLLFQRIQNIKSQTSIENSVSVKEIDRAIYYVNLLKDILIRSRFGGLEVEVDRIGGDGASTLTIGAVAQLRNMHTSILDTYSKYLLWRQAKVLVDTVRTGVMGITIILPSGSAAVQSTVLNVDSLAWFGGKRWLAHRYNYQSSLRGVVAEIPQQMVFALSNEFSNTWLLVDVTLSAIERSLSTTGPDPVGARTTATDWRFILWIAKPASQALPLRTSTFQVRARRASGRYGSIRRSVAMPSTMPGSPSLLGTRDRRANSCSKRPLPTISWHRTTLVMPFSGRMLRLLRSRVFLIFGRTTREQPACS